MAGHNAALNSATHFTRFTISLDDAGVIQSRVVAYASQQAHSSAERAALLGGVRVRLLPVDEDFSLRGETLASAIEEDRAKVKGPYINDVTQI
jgi:glutamate/tyrosine decarboxylase-like PLP-dependent enzyme